MPFDLTLGGGPQSYVCREDLGTRSTPNRSSWPLWPGLRKVFRGNILYIDFEDLSEKCGILDDDTNENLDFICLKSVPNSLH